MRDLPKRGVHRKKLDFAALLKKNIFMVKCPFFMAFSVPSSYYICMYTPLFLPDRNRVGVRGLPAFKAGL